MRDYRLCGDDVDKPFTKDLIVGGVNYTKKVWNEYKNFCQLNGAEVPSDDTKLHDTIRQGCYRRFRNQTIDPKKSRKGVKEAVYGEVRTEQEARVGFFSRRGEKQPSKEEKVFNHLRFKTRVANIPYYVTTILIFMIGLVMYLLI